MIEWKEHKLYSYADYEYRLNQWKVVQIIKKYAHNCLKVLDVGCGTGNLSQDVKRYFSEVYGVDIDPVAAKEAKEKIDVIIASAEFLPFRKDVFDAVISNQVIEHVMNVDSFFMDINRVLKSKGLLIISTPNLCALHNRILILLGMQPTCLHVSKVQVGNFLKGVKTSGHIHAFSPSALENLLHLHGFRIIKILGTGMYPFKAPLSKIFCKLFPRLAVYLLIEARKVT
jgi:2-polyprenyl-3-methyl-5-hydroxy-6-metoxy-1,4-benzoquinol methylase